MRRSTWGKPSTCHPERPHFSNGLCRPCYQKHWRTYVNPTYHARVNAMQKYGLTLEEQDKLLAKGTCDLCGVAPKKTKIRNLVIDHDHETGKLRGILCRSCNTHLGWYERKASVIAKYLEKYGRS